MSQRRPGVTLRQSTTPSGWSMRSDRSRARHRFSTTSGAIPIANNRLVSMDDGKVSFRWKDYRDDNRRKTMTLSGEEFIRRCLIHVLPDGFHRIRYFGFLGNCHRARKLKRCRELLGMASPIPADPPADYRDRYQALTGQSLRECPHCRTGIMVVIGCVARPEICVLVPNSS